jgi:hypothetical protein
MCAMDSAKRVEAVARRIDKDLDVEYLGYAEINRLGARYIDAADFLFAAPKESKLRVHVSGRDCFECQDDTQLESLLRERIAAALKKTLYG